MVGRRTCFSTHGTAPCWTWTLRRCGENQISLDIYFQLNISQPGFAKLFLIFDWFWGSRVRIWFLATSNLPSRWSYCTTQSLFASKSLTPPFVSYGGCITISVRVTLYLRVNFGLYIIRPWHRHVQGSTSRQTQPWYEQSYAILQSAVIEIWQHSRSDTHFVWTKSALATKQCYD